MTGRPGMADTSLRETVSDFNRGGHVVATELLHGSLLSRVECAAASKGESSFSTSPHGRVGAPTRLIAPWLRTPPKKVVGFSAPTANVWLQPRGKTKFDDTAFECDNDDRRA